MKSTIKIVCLYLVLPGFVYLLLPVISSSHLYNDVIANHEWAHDAVKEVLKGLSLLLKIGILTFVVMVFAWGVIEHNAIPALKEVLKDVFVPVFENGFVLLRDGVRDGIKEKGLMVQVSHEPTCRASRQVGQNA